MFDNLILVIGQEDPQPKPPSNPGNAAGDPAGANSSTTTPPGSGGSNSQPVNDGGWFLMLMFGGIILLWIMMWRSNKRERQKQTQMQDSLAKNMKVQTIGGIIGIISEVKEHEVVLKIDESNGTRMHLSKGAIKGILDSAGKDG